MISIEDLAAILDTFCAALWSLELETFYKFDHGPDRNLQTNSSTGPVYNAKGYPLFTCNLITQSPDLTRLRLTAIDTTDEVTRGFGEKLEHLHLQVQGKLPRIGCMNLISLDLFIFDDREDIFDDREDLVEDHEDIFDGEAGDLSTIRCLDITLIPTEGAFSQDQAISVMRSYNIGRNLEGLMLYSNSVPVEIYWRDIGSQAPILRTLTTLVDKSYVSDSELMRESMSYETIRKAGS
jgi:hypothetical protein